jgi:hypothetical protein
LIEINKNKFLSSYEYNEYIINLYKNNHNLQIIKIADNNKGNINQLISSCI